MTDKKAQNMIEHLNPILQFTPGIVRKLGIDFDNQDILFFNIFNAVIFRVYYAESATRKVLFDIVENLI